MRERILCRSASLLRTGDWIPQTTMSCPSNDMRSVATAAQSVDVQVGPVRRWMVVGGSTALVWATYGLLASNGIFLSYWSANQLAGLAHSTTAWINGVHLFLNWSLTFPIGIVFDKRGSNMLLFVGSAFYLAGIFGMAESSRFWQFMVTYGILGGAGSAILSTVAISVLGHWFDKRKGLATGTVILGGSLGGVVFPLALRPMFEEIGWSWSIRALGFFLTILIGLGLFTVRSRAPVMHTRPVAIRSVLRPTFLLATLGIGGKSHQSSYAHQQLIPGRFRFRLIWSPWTAPRVWAKFRTHRGNWLSLGRHCQRVRTLPFCAGILS